MKPLLRSVRESLEVATRTFEGHLAAGGREGPAAVYLQARGIDPDTAHRFRLGYVADSEVPGFERFVGRLAIPYICAGGHVVTMKFRALDDETEPKYDGLALPTRLFNLAALNEAERVLWVVEGELDAISLGVLGAPAVAVPGANNWKKHHERILEGFDKIVLIQDDDDAGSDMADRLRRTELPVHVVRPPKPFKDINAALAAGHRDDIRALIERTAA